MNIITEKIEAILKDAFKKAGYDSKYGEISISNRKDLGQFQCNGALSSCKVYKKNPMVIADEIVNLIKDNPFFKDVNVASPGFINLTISDKELVKFLSALEKDKSFAIIKSPKKEKIVIDYGGPNIAKPLHVGHLRSAIIGESIKRISKVMGHKVIGDIHMGDWGLQMGLVLAGIEEKYPKVKAYNGEGDIKLSVTLDDLNDIYPTASKKAKEDEAFKEVASEITRKLQNKDKKYYKLWKQIVKISTHDLKKNYDYLGVNFDCWLGESDASEYIEPLIKKLEDDNLLYESDGAMVVDVRKEDDQYEVPPILIKKSNGALLYATTDLATIIQREHDFKPSKIWYVVDNRQSMHFEQVIRCVRKAKLIKDEIDIEHLGFGTMNGEDGKPFKTRSGGVLRLSDLINIVVSGAEKKVSDLSYDSKEKEEIAKKVGIAALKFGDLINYRGKDYVFSLEKFLSFEGKTGPYLLYTVARINSILNKVKLNDIDDAKYLEPLSEEERDLMLNLFYVSDAYQNAYNEKAPNIIADHVYNLCVIFNKFYANNKILSEENKLRKASWIKLIKLTKNIIEFELNSLGIETVDRM